MMSLKKSFIALALLPLLTACSGASNNDVGNDLVQITKVPVSISVPKAWRELKDADLSKIGTSVVLAYASLTYTNGFANNISITQESLGGNFSSLDYARSNMINSSKFLDGYVKLDEKDATIKDENNADIATKIHFFQARFDMTSNARKYVQLYATRNNVGYTVTVVTSADETDLGKFENLVRTFHFVKQ